MKTAIFIIMLTMLIVLKLLVFENKEAKKVMKTAIYFIVFQISIEVKSYC